MSAPSSVSTLSLPRKRKQKSFDFDSIQLSLASPDEIRKWSYGEVLEPETINYRTRKPERDGLFCQKIFGPVKDFKCACGKYKKIRYKGIVCDRCGVEVTRSLVRRERFGHIDLAAPVSHIWFLRGLPSKIGMVLGMSIKNIEKVIYFANFVIISVDEELKEEVLEKLKKEFTTKLKEVETDTEKEEIKDRYKDIRKQIKDLKEKQLITEVEYRELSLKYGHIFNAGIGAEAISKLLAETDLEKLSEEVKKSRDRTKSKSKVKKLTKRLKFIDYFIHNDIKPEWMILKNIPVIPPKLRPLVPLDGGRFASSDLNDLYRRVINRNNRLKKLYDLNAPEVILRNEKRMLQEAVDALIDNSKKTRKTTTASTGQKRPLKSLADMLKGKQGRFRRNLLGKRVDYSGRSVIVVGPKLTLDQCGLPKAMAAELFKPFVASKLIKKEIVHNVHSANNLIDRGTDEVWECLEEVVKDAYVLLNRAPTLHRLGIQAFQPILIEGKAIQLHPLVCAAFNADFDGDQMAVHVPITKQAQKEAKEIMLATHNILKPSSGEPIVTPPKDMVWGAYYMTKYRVQDEGKDIYKEGKKELNVSAFSNEEDAINAYESNEIDINEKILLKTDDGRKETCVGRIIFKNILPKGLYKMDKVINKTILKAMVAQIIREEGIENTAQYLDNIKKYTLKYLTMSGFSWAMGDLPELKEKDEVLEKAQDEVDKINDQYEEGLLSEEEKSKKVVDIWLEAKEVITGLVEKALPHNTVYSMVESGARGSWNQLSQMFGMKGTVISPTGKRMELPIKSAYKQGLDVLEYFISTHGSRKGLADTALRTAKAGYLTRRLVDVAQDILVREDDCGDEEGLLITRKGTKRMNTTWFARLKGRYASDTIKDPKTGKVIVKKNEIIDREKAQAIEKADPETIKIRSALTCKSKRGVCTKCYGYDLGYNKIVKKGTPVGVIAAQSIGEPGTQLTLRTFHSGGVAGKDITQGLPRAEQLFEARAVKKRAILAHKDGVVEVRQEDGEQKLIVKYNKTKTTEKSKKSKKNKNFREHNVAGFSLWVKDGDSVKKGDQLTDGHIDLEELYKLKGRRAVEKYILREIQYIYSSHGQTLNEKHIEIIIRKMFSRCLVIDAGDTSLLPGEVIPKSYFEEENDKLKGSKTKTPAKAKEMLVGITKVSLSTDSWLSSASFQRTSRSLTKAAISGRVDHLYGLKENVIVGRLIPAGTGWKEKKDK